MSINAFHSNLRQHVKKYVEDHGRVDVEVLADNLQKMYRDYGRRKKNNFRKKVAQVYSELISKNHDITGSSKHEKSNQIKRKDQDESNSCDDDDDDDDDTVEYKDSNMMNQSLSSMYGQSYQHSSVQLGPSGDSQTYGQHKMNIETIQKEDSSNLGWYIDKDGTTGRKSTPKTTLANATCNIASSNLSDDAHVSSTFQPSNNHQFKENAFENEVNNGISDLSLSNIRVDSTTNQTHGGNTDNLKRKLQDKRTSMRKRKRYKNKGKESEEDSEVLPNRKQFTVQNVDLTFDDIAGCDAALQKLSGLLFPMSHPEAYNTLGVSPPRGMLLHGPPGCGKTLLGRAIAGELDLPLIYLVGPELIGGVSGESERRVRDVFEIAQSNAPCAIFLDEIDAIAQKRDNSSKEMERRIVAQLLACLDNLNQSSHQVMVIGATNRLDTLDPGLRRAGRFDREIGLGIPDEKARKQILMVMCRKLKLAEDINFDLIARLTPGYVGADLESLCREAAMQTVARIFNFKINSNHKYSGTEDGRDCLRNCLRNKQPFSEQKLEMLSFETNDFVEAIGDVQPSAKREGFATVPGVTWKDIGALESIRDELSIAILGPVRNPLLFASAGLSRATGVLLAGPPGCGKTLLAKAIANESGINFISVKGPELLNMYVGESERAVRQCFERARDSSPCVIFFDELDSLCPRRSAVEAGASARVVNQMLTELDGLESRKQVFVIAATNRPDIIDPAILRPGRLDKTLYVGIPSSEDRVKILRTITKDGSKPSLAADVSLEALGKSERCAGFTGADLSALVREAALNAIREIIQHGWDVILPENGVEQGVVKVSQQNIDAAFAKVHPSITKKDQRMYAEMKEKYKPIE